MSHFNVLVIGPKNEKELEAALQPFHEFECTGFNDQYVQDIDRTEEAREEYENSDKTESFAQFVRGYYGWDVVPVGSVPDTEGKHKYGYILCDSSGEVLKCVDRTNPNKQWDWWVIGGRWHGMLQPKTQGVVVMGEADDKTGECDSLRVRDLDVKTMKDRKWKKSNESFEAWRAAQDGLPVARTWQDLLTVFGKDKIEEARKAYQSQPRVQALRKVGYYSETVEAYLCVPGVDSEEVIQKARFDAGKRAAEQCLTPFAILDARTSPKWYQRGEMCWFGIVSDAKDTDQWGKEVSALLDSIDGDTVVTVVDCHI